MADKTGTVYRYKQLLQNVGKSGLNAAFPNDFEL